MAGYNATVFAYGQTGSGKTYTMVRSKMRIGMDGHGAGRGRGKRSISECRERGIIGVWVQVNGIGRGKWGYFLRTLTASKVLASHF
jgi:hypothetical protein